MLTALAFFGFGIAILLFIKVPWPWGLLSFVFVVGIVDWGRGWIAQSRNKKGLCASCKKEIAAYPLNKVQMTGRMGGVYVNVCTNCLKNEKVITRATFATLLLLIVATLGFVLWAKNNGS